MNNKTENDVTALGYESLTRTIELLIKHSSFPKNMKEELLKDLKIIHNHELKD